jgi:hypothetical protein
MQGKTGVRAIGHPGCPRPQKTEFEDTTWRVIAYEGKIEEEREKWIGLCRTTRVSSSRAIAGCCQLHGSPEKALRPDGQSYRDLL